MSMKYILIVLVGLFASVGAPAQEFSLSYRLGWGSFAMRDLGNLQIQRQRDLVVDAALLDKYPAHFTHQLQGIWMQESLWMGASYLRMTTGSRISYHDYSGEIRFDSKVAAHGLGLLVGHPLVNTPRYHLLLGGQLIMTHSSLALTDFVRIGNQQQRESLEVYAAGLLAEPLVRMSAKLAFIELGVEAGYRLNLTNEDFHLKGQKEAKLVNAAGRYLKPDWSGYNMALVCGVRF
jgi:hypothetical protein